MQASFTTCSYLLKHKFSMHFMLLSELSEFRKKRIWKLGSMEEREKGTIIIINPESCG